MQPKTIEVLIFSKRNKQLSAKIPEYISSVVKIKKQENAVGETRLEVTCMFQGADPSVVSGVIPIELNVGSAAYKIDLPYLGWQAASGRTASE